ncbi:Fc.00g053820.m01.CDS01 [Cosmosporella sp. VM-42]
MASYSRDRRDSLRTHRRDSLSHNASRQRPRLLRSSATEPSITTSNAIRGPMGSSNSPQKATDILSRVAVYSPPPGDLERSTTPEPVSRRQVEAIAICREDHEQSPTSSQDVVLVDSPSGYYFSFPSFDNWHRDKQAEDIDKDTDD